MKKKLTKENINSAVSNISSFLDSNKIRKSESLRVSFGMEEALLNYEKAFGNDAEFEIKTGKLFGKIKLSVYVDGDAFDPSLKSSLDDENSEFMRSMLLRLGNRPVWNYRNKSNIVSFFVKRQLLPEWARLLIAIVLGLILGFCLRVLPGEAVAFIQKDLFAPLLDTFLGFLNAVAGPMIFLSVVSGIYSMGDSDSFSNIGKKLGMRFLIYVIAVSVIIALLLLPFFNFSIGSVQRVKSFSVIYRMILDIVPSNLFAPFASGNTLQLLFLAIVIGICMTVVGTKNHYISSLFDELNLIIQELMGAISRLIPLFVFGSVFKIVISSDFSSLRLGGKFLIVCFVLSLFMILIELGFSSIYTHQSPQLIFKKNLSSFLIALTTASSSASLADNISTCINKHNIDPRLANFGVPFVQVLYKPGTFILYYVAAMSMAEAENVQISTIWICTALFTGILLSAASPPIAGGPVAGFTVMFSVLGIPMDNIGILLGLSVILDFVLTAANIFCGQCLLLDEASRIKRCSKDR